MSSALRPYVTAGIALAGTSLIAVTSVAPPAPAVQVRAVELANVDATTGADPVIAYFNGGSGGQFQNATDLYDAGLYVHLHYPDAIMRGLGQPGQLYPILGLHQGFLDDTEKDATKILNAIMQTQVGEGHHVVFFGYSGGATENSLELNYLSQLPSDERPSPDQLAFMMVGDPNNPNGGMLDRFDIPGIQTQTFPDLANGSLGGLNGFTGSTGVLSLPTIGITFNGPTPTDTPYTDIIYTGEYDGFADFPEYPDDLLADINAAYGIAFVHNQVADYPLSLINQSFTWQPSPGYDGDTTWYMIPTQDLPMLDPLRDVPVIGTPLADLLQPDLKILVNLGFGPDNLPYSEDPNVFTPIQPGLPDVSPTTLFNELVAGAKEGIQNFHTDLSQITPSEVMGALQQLAAHPLNILTGLADAFTLGAIPQVSLPTVTPLDLNPSNFADQLQILLTDNSNALAILATRPLDMVMPMADILAVIGITIPTYDVNLAGLGIHELMEGNLNSAGTYFGDIPAATAGLYSIADQLIIGSGIISNTLGPMSGAATSVIGEDLDFLAGLPGLLS